MYDLVPSLEYNIFALAIKFNMAVVLGDWSMTRTHPTIHLLPAVRQVHLMTCGSGGWT